MHPGEHWCCTGLQCDLGHAPFPLQASVRWWCLPPRALVRFGLDSAGKGPVLSKELLS